MVPRVQPYCRGGALWLLIYLMDKFYKIANTLKNGAKIQLGAGKLDS